MKKQIVILGAGHAGVQAAASLREEGFDGTIALVDGQKALPYQRPPLSKAFMKGETSAERIVLRSEKFYVDQAIDLHLGSMAESIDPVSRQVHIREGASVLHSLPYDMLVLATGARARAFPVEGSHLKGVLSLRDLTDAEAIRTAMSNTEDIVVIGAGFIGLEFAAVAASAGKHVTVLEMQGRVMARAISPQMSEVFAAKHRQLGVNLRFGCSISKLVGNKGHLAGVELEDGSKLKAGLAVVGIGVLAEDRLAAEAGLDFENGIVVDPQLRTSNPPIFAIGDNNTHYNRYCSGRIRLESVQNAVDQGRHVAGSILGKTGAYNALPWFWSDQGDYKLQIAGVARNLSKSVTRGDSASDAFSIFGFEGDRLATVESLNRPGDHMMARRLIEAAIPVSPKDIGNPDFDLKALIRK